MVKPVAHNAFQYKIVAKKGEDSAEVLIYGDIGESWWGESISAKQFVKDLNALDVDYINVRINSYGGSVSDGIAIYNAIKRHKAAVTTYNDGVAMSMGSYIFMAGDTRVMPKNALLMLHAPWGGIAGNAAELRKYADVLDMYASAMADAYASASGKSVDDIMALLKDGEDHYFDADEAVTEGYATELGEDIRIAAMLPRDRFPNLPAAAAAFIRNKESNPMPKENNPAATDPKVVEIDDAAKAKAVAELKARNDKMAGTFKGILGNAKVKEEYDAIIHDPTVTFEQATDRLMAKLGEGVEPIAGAHAPRIEAGQSDMEKQRNAAADVLMYRAGLHRMQGNGVKPIVIDLQGNPYVGATLLDMAKAAVRRGGKNPDGMTKMEVVAAAFQTADDFPVLLENVMHKTLLQSFATAADTWRRFCAIGQVSDFRPHNRYRAGSLGNLDTMNEHGEFKTKAIPDGEKASVTAETKGNIIGVSRKTIVNDDLGALTGLAAMLGRAAARTIEADVYALLALNSGAGPTMDDTYALFHANHGNLVASGSGAAPSMTTIEAGRVLMASQMDISGNDYLDIRPAVWLGPLSLGGTAREVNGAEYNDEATKNQRRPNVVRGLFRDIIDTPRISAGWYMFADPNDAPVIDVSFLDGVQEPFIEAQNGWHVDGAELKVRADYSVGAVDYRGAMKNHGS